MSTKTKKQLPTGARIIITAGVCVVVYEGIAYTLNKTLGVGLPYTPMQVTPCNMESAAITCAGVAATAIFNSIMWR